MSVDLSSFWLTKYRLRIRRKGGCISKCQGDKGHSLTCVPKGIRGRKNGLIHRQSFSGIRKLLVSVYRSETSFAMTEEFVRSEKKLSRRWFKEKIDENDDNDTFSGISEEEQKTQNENLNVSLLQTVNCSVLWLAKDKGRLHNVKPYCSLISTKSVLRRFFVYVAIRKDDFTRIFSSHRDVSTHSSFSSVFLVSRGDMIMGQKTRAWWIGLNLSIIFFKYPILI